MKNDNHSPEKLKSFGLTMALICAGFVLISIYKNSALTTSGLVLCGLTFLFGFFGLVLPTALGPVESAWMKLAELISQLMNPIVLSIIYFILVTPIALVLRIIGKDILKLKIDKKKLSYWEPVEKDGPGSRHFTPY